MRSIIRPIMTVGTLAFTLLGAALPAKGGSIPLSPASMWSAAGIPSIDALDDYAVFGRNVNLSNVTVNGTVGVSANGQLKLMAPSSVSGGLYLDGGVAKTLAGSYGALYAPTDLSTARGQLFGASSAIAALAPDTTYSSWSNAMSIAGNGGLNVIDITGGVNLNSKSVTLTGGVSDVFVINVFGGFSLGGSGGIIAGTGMDASRILINIVGTGSKVTSHVNNELDATIFSPERAVEFHSVSGAVYGGDLEIKLMSGAQVDYMAFTPPQSVPLPAALWSALTVFGGIGTLRGARRGLALVCR